MKTMIRAKILRAERYARTHTTRILGIVSILLCLSILLSQLLRIRREHADPSSPAAQIAALQQEMNEAQKRYASLQDEKDRLTNEKITLVDDFLQNNPLVLADVEALQASLGLARVMAGSTSITGAGITLLLSDPEGIDYSTATAADIIHEQDVMSAVNLIKSNGAVAMAVNGERLTATSKLICNGPTILVNRQLLSAPFVITAVGDTEQMLNAIQNDAQILHLRNTGKTVQISQQQDMIIPAFNDQVIIDKALDMMKEVLES